VTYLYVGHRGNRGNELGDYSLAYLPRFTKENTQTYSALFYACWRCMLIIPGWDDNGIFS
jgi:hypothetical protein